MAAEEPQHAEPLPSAISFEVPTLCNPTPDDIIEYCLPYLSIKDVVNLRLTSKSLLAASAGHAPDHLSLVKLALGAPGSMRIFEVYGARLRSLSLQRVTTAADALAVAKVLALCPYLRKVSISDLDWSWSDEATAAAIGALGSLTELRLQCADALSADRLPFAAIVRSSLGQLPTLRKLTLFSRLDGGAMLALLAYLGDRASRRLYKLKISTGLLASPGGAELIEAVAVHGTLSKLTVVRPDGIGEPLRKGHCSLLGIALVRNKHLMALHLRRCGLWTDSLSALVPPAVAPHVQRLKLDGNSLGYLAGAFFNEAADALLSRLPNLTSLHLGNNQLSGAQVEGLATTFTRYKLHKLENLTVGSNDIGDEGIRHLVKALPPSIRQLYLHGIDASDKGVAHICAMLPNWPALWGLGLNGNPITDDGAKTLAKALRGNTSLRDIGITLSEMTDVGVAKLAAALETVPNLRYVYLYSSGFKAATRVTDAGKQVLRSHLPQFATAALNHQHSRYLKTPN